jgi:hypothetical protein
MGTIVENFTDGFLGTFSRKNLGALATKAILPLLSAAALGGCAIHPVQRDVTNLPLKIVVDRIRCEARLAVLDKAIGLLRQSKDPTGRSAVIADRLESQRGGPIVFNPVELPTTQQRMFYNRYINTVIAYDFLFNITEDNKVAGAVDPIRLITNGTAGIGINGSSDFNRNNLRKFDLSDSFGNLLSNKKLDCGTKDYVPDNYVYPIAGSVGLREIIDTFIDLNEDQPLSQLASSGPTVFADTLQFTTTLSGAVGPHVQIDPVGNRFGLASPTSLVFSASRTDIHTLTVGLAMGPPGNAPVSVVVGSRPRLFSRDGVPAIARATPSSATNEQNAFRAIEDLRYRNFLDRAGTFVVR